MVQLVTSVILAGVFGAPMESGFSESGYTESVRVYQCDFEHHNDDVALESDINYDGWPDRWTRRRGRGYPKYVGLAIKPDPKNASNSCLTIDLDGGAAEAYSPAADVSSLFSYRLHARMNLEGLKHDSAFFSITFYDAEEKRLESHFSKRLTTTDGWTDISIGPLTPKDTSARFAKIGVHLRPGERMDLWGTARFDDIQLKRLPRMQLIANKQFHFYEDGSEVEVTCRISGIQKSQPTVTFELIDVHGRNVKTETFPLKLVELRQVSSRKKEDSAKKRHGSEPDGRVNIRRGYEARQTWRPNISNDDLGFYEVRASIRDGERLVLERSVSLVLGRAFVARPSGRFGWSITRNEGPMSLRELAQLIRLAGVHWVKLPIWFDEKGSSLPDEIAWFAERMSSSGVNLVGVLDQPPMAIGSGAIEIDKPPIALVFDEEDVWKPLVNPVMTRLSLKMRWWQLGADDDVSFVGFEDLPARIRAIKHYLERFGQEVRLGFSWPWMNDLPVDSKAPWSFVSLSSEVPFTHNELQEALAATESPELMDRRWAMIRVLNPDHYDVDVRARDLVLRMLGAKISGASAVFAADPFHEKYGLMRPDGSPNAMLLPWRTTTHLTAGSEYVGTIKLPSGSHNFIFADNGDAVMVVWNDDDDVDEVLYLGEDVKAYDVWGRTRQLGQRVEKGAKRQVVHVGVSPLFLTGVNLPVARWRLAFQFDKQRLMSSSGQTQRVHYSVKNPFARGVATDIRIHTPQLSTKLWETTPQVSHFDLSDGEVRELPVDIKLGSYTPSGKQPVRIDFRVTSDRVYQFSAYRSLEVGLGDLKIEVDTELDYATGNLVVYVHLDNNTEKRAQFNCLMFIKDRRRKRLRLSSSGRGRTTSTFIANKGSELIGESIFIQAREMNGSRTLNYRLTARE